MNPQETLFILVHDAWHGKWAWDGVIERLDERGWQAAALDLPAHNATELALAGDMSLEAYADSLVDFTQQEKTRYGADKIVLVAHGTGGPVTQLAAEKLGGAVAALIFAGAYILRDGESIAGQMPPEQAVFFQSLADSRSDGRIDLADVADFWRFNVIQDDMRRADELLARLVPEPAKPLFEPISLKSFFAQHPSSAYISFNDDLSLPPGYFYPLMANKLGPHRHMTVNAGHEGILTKPREVAEALVFLASQGL